jgi:4-hydroxybenzoate polyprenyltransferase
VALNDVLDARWDALERPERPIPSGRVSRTAAAVFSLSLMFAGMMVARAQSANSGAVAAGVVVSAMLYDGPLKRSAVGPLLMGTCRALNLGLGMTVIPEYRTIVGLTPVLFLHGLYVVSLTFFARHETEAGHVRRLRHGTLGMGAAVAGLGFLCVLVPRARLSYVLPVLGLAAFVVRRGLGDARDPVPARIQASVRAFITSLVVFDSCIAWAARGPLAASAVLIWLIPTQLTKRWSRMT